jgi:hypothetical protein
MGRVCVEFWVLRSFSFAAMDSGEDIFAWKRGILDIYEENGMFSCKF